jgi:hypothetical protein
MESRKRDGIADLNVALQQKAAHIVAALRTVRREAALSIEARRVFGRPA